MTYGRGAPPPHPLGGSPFGAPPVGGAHYGSPPAPPQDVNVLAILSVIFAFVFAPAGVVLGHRGLIQIRRTGQRGRGLALAGLILSYVCLAVAVVSIAVLVIASSSKPSAAVSAHWGVVTSVDKDQVARQISTMLAQQVGHEPDSVHCPDDLNGTVGATLRCEMTDAGQHFGVTVTVTSVEGTDVRIHVKVDDHTT
jgi:hypothetical protein